jgi:hypothetical protein
MRSDTAASGRRLPDFLLSWDRLGFRLLVFGGLALMWILQGRLAGLSWQDLIRSEVGGLLPWAFLAPLVLSYNRRIQRRRAGRATRLRSVPSNPGSLDYLAGFGAGAPPLSLNSSRAYSRRLRRQLWNSWAVSGEM